MDSKVISSTNGNIAPSKLSEEQVKNKPTVKRKRSRRITHFADAALNMDIEERLQQFRADRDEKAKQIPLFQDIYDNSWILELIPDKLYSFKQQEDTLIDAFCCKWSKDGRQFAVGSSIGTIDIYTRYQGKARTLHSGKLSGCTSVKWITVKGKQQPVSSGVSFGGVSFGDDDVEDAKGTQAILATYTNGTAILWDAARSKSILKIQETGNQINCTGYNYGKQEFCTAGSDRIIRMYDLEKHKLKSEWQTGEDKNKKQLGHFNRIFALKYKPDDMNILFSGSWDDNIFAWDTRSNKVIRSIHGPHLAGQAIDYQDGIILTGSWRPEFALEQWDFGTNKRMKQIQTKAAFDDGNGQHLVESLLVYQTMYIPDGGIGSNGVRMYEVGIACGSAANCVVMFDMKTGAFSNEVGLNENGYPVEVSKKQMDFFGGTLDEEQRIVNAKMSLVNLADEDDIEQDDDGLQDEEKEMDSKKLDTMRDIVVNGGGVYCVDIDPLGEYIIYGGDKGRIGVSRIDLNKVDSKKNIQFSRRSSFATTELLNL